MAESHEHDNEEFCYICFEGATRGASGELESLVQVCRCPTRVHRRCVARWQLYSAGKREEKSCRFCQDALPDWKEVLTPRALPPAVPVLSIYYNNTCCRMKVRPGPDGLQAFLRQLEAIVGRDVANVNFVFRCRCPDTGAEIFLQGLQAFEAAMHCACVRAAQRSLQQHQHHQQQQQQQHALLVQQPPPQQQPQQEVEQQQQLLQRFQQQQQHRHHHNPLHQQQRQLPLGSGVSYMLGDTTAAPAAAAAQGPHLRRASAPTERTINPAASAGLAASAVRSGDPSSAVSGSSGRHPSGATLESFASPRGGGAPSFCVEAGSQVSTSSTATLSFSPPPPLAAAASPAPSPPLPSQQREHQRRPHHHCRLTLSPSVVETATATAAVQQVTTPRVHCRTSAFQPRLLDSGDDVMPGSLLPGAVHVVSARASSYLNGIETPSGSESRTTLSRSGTGASSTLTSLAAAAEAAAVVARVAAFVSAPCVAAAGSGRADGGPLPPSGPAAASVAAELSYVASLQGAAQPFSKRANGAGSCVSRGDGGGKVSGSGGGKVAAALKSLKSSLLRRFGRKSVAV